MNTPELQALNQIHTRTYEGDNGETVVVVGSREHCGPQEYVETAFVFDNGKLVKARISARGKEFVALTPQAA